MANDPPARPSPLDPGFPAIAGTTLGGTCRDRGTPRPEVIGTCSPQQLRTTLGGTGLWEGGVWTATPGILLPNGILQRALQGARRLKRKSRLNLNGFISALGLCRWLPCERVRRT